MHPKQKHVRTIVTVDGEQFVEKLTFYPSIIPDSDEKLWQIIHEEWGLLAKEDITLVRTGMGGLDIIPSLPQLRPEDLREKYLIVQEKEESRATITIRPDEGKHSLLSVLEALNAFQTIHIVYDSPLLIDL